MSKKGRNESNIHTPHPGTSLAIKPLLYMMCEFKVNFDMGDDVMRGFECLSSNKLYEPYRDDGFKESDYMGHSEGTLIMSYRREGHM